MRGKPVRLVAVIFGIWFVLVGIILAIEVGPHMAPFRRSTVAAPAAATGRWQVTHVLAAGCECSRIVAASLLAHGPEPEALNRVTVIGGDPQIESSLAGAGFAADHATAADAFSRYGIRGAPWLFITRPDGSEAYSGGYASRRPIAASDVRTTEIATAVRAGQSVKTFPSFGCIFQPTSSPE